MKTQIVNNFVNPDTAFTLLVPMEFTWRDRY